MRQHFYRLASLAALSLFFVAPARAADLTYTVSGIHVDSTAASASAAQAIAIDGGRPRAWTSLYRRLAKQPDWPKQPQLDALALQHLFRGYTPHNEKRSTTRYVADITYVFSPEAVSRVMGTVSSAYAVQVQRRILLIPMSPEFNRSGGFVNAFSSTRFSGSAVPFLVPSSDTPDVTALGRVKFDVAGWPDVQLVAARIHATEAVFILATVNGKVMNLELKRVGIAEMPSTSTVQVAIVGSVTQTYPAAADAALLAIEDLWKSKSPMGLAKNRLTADIRTSSLEQWAALQTAMSSIPSVTGVQILAMDIGLVRVSVSFQGTSDQLRDAWAAVGVALTKESDNWTIASAPPVKPNTVSATP